MNLIWSIYFKGKQILKESKIQLQINDFFYLGKNQNIIEHQETDFVDNIISTVDYNKKQIDGSTDDVMNLGNLRAKWEAFGWTVLEMNGNDMQDVVDGLNKAKGETGKGKPVMILMHTEMGYPVDFMMGTHKWHGVAPNDEQLKNALSQLPETLGDY